MSNLLENRWHFTMNPPIYSPNLGITIPPLIQGSTGSIVAMLPPFVCSGWGWISCAKAGYIKAGCWPPRPPSGYMEPVCIPIRPTCCRAANPEWGRLKRWVLDPEDCWFGGVYGCFGWGEHESDPRVDVGLLSGLLLWNSPGDTESMSNPLSASCASSASIRKFLDLSMVVVILLQDAGGTKICLKIATELLKF